MKIRIDVPKATEYRGEIMSFILNLGELLSDMNAALKNLSDSWQDEQFEDFNTEFSRCIQQASNIQETCSMIIPRIDEEIEEAKKIENVRKI